MFTGIVAEVGKVASIQPDKLTVSAGELLKGIQLGGSVAVNGACLTVTSFTPDSFTVDLSPETVKRTSLESLKAGDPVNLERPMLLGGELGGHLVQGHVDGTGRIIAIFPEGVSTVFRFEAPDEIMRYLVEKGFIAIDGISLTITAREAGWFQVSVVEFSKTHTNLGSRKTGDLVNLEIDIMAKYAEQFMKLQHSGITLEYLKENGF
ncbi:MAG: riboflavin synthase [Dehalococcoidales bacterium]|nr:riboflavin synthase [Dehalococcoidales bacterium]